MAAIKEIKKILDRLEQQVGHDNNRITINIIDSDNVEIEGDYTGGFNPKTKITITIGEWNDGNDD